MTRLEVKTIIENTAATNAIVVFEFMGRRFTLHQSQANAMIRCLTLLVALNIIGFLAPRAAFSQSEESIAHIWNEEVLEGIRNDFARPTVHARNLLHTNIAMYDCWSAFDEGT